MAHADTDDARGIDVAFLYDETKFSVPAGETFFHVVMRRNATREIVQVNFRTVHGGRTWAVFGNHWPSRSGGQLESAGYRHIAGETLGYFHQRVLEVHGPATPVLAMGDFNDEPFDTSLVAHALSTRQRARCSTRDTRCCGTSCGRHGRPAGQPDGTFYFNNQPNLLDQFLVNKNMADDTSPIRVRRRHGRDPPLPGHVDHGDYPGRSRSAAWASPVDQDGFSDHFPIGMVVTEAD